MIQKKLKPSEFSEDRKKAKQEIDEEKESKADLMKDDSDIKWIEE